MLTQIHTKEAIRLARLIPIPQQNHPVFPHQKNIQKGSNKAFKANANTTTEPLFLHTRKKNKGSNKVFKANANSQHNRSVFRHQKNTQRKQ